MILHLFDSLEPHQQLAQEVGDPAMRLGLTVSKKVGNAVTRNRMKRRFRELARAVLPESGHPGADHVLIGRQGGIERDFGLLADELRKALAKLKGKTVRAEPVEALPFSAAARKDRPSTGSGRTGEGSEAQS